MYPKHVPEKVPQKCANKCTRKMYPNNDAENAAGNGARKATKIMNVAARYVCPKNVPEKINKAIQPQSFSAGFSALFGRRFRAAVEAVDLAAVWGGLLETVLRERAGFVTESNEIAPEKCARKMCPKNVPEKCARKMCPKNVPEKLSQKHFPG